MTKAATSQPSNSSTKPLATREGLKRFTGDVVGFRDCVEQGEIYGIPRASKVIDSKIQPDKPSVFVIFELLEDCKVTEGSGEDGKEVLAKKGEMVGVWVSGGMRPLKKLCGVPVLMQYTGEKKLKGRPAAQSPMKVYQFDVGVGTPTEIPLIEDMRKESRNVVSHWCPAHTPSSKPVSRTQEREPGDDSEEDPGF